MQLVLAAAAVNVARYILVAGGLHFLLGHRFDAQARRELWAGLRSSLIFAALAWPCVAVRDLWPDAAFAHTLAGNVVALALMLLLQDAAFYWSHRAMHTRVLYPIHRFHHRAAHPTALSAFAFTPAEALVQGLPCALLYVLVPAHEATKLVFVTLTFVMAVYGHAFPNPHREHHLFPNHNFGLYLPHWDRLFRTARPALGPSHAHQRSPVRPRRHAGRQYALPLRRVASDGANAGR